MKKNEEYPLVSIVVPIYNCSQNLYETLEKLTTQVYLGGLEIIAVDNNSTDHSDKIIKQFLSVKLIYQRDAQSAAITRNMGIKVAQGEIIAFIDGDCIPEPDWLSQGIQAIKEADVDRLGGKIGVKPLFLNSSVYALIDALFCFDQESATKNTNACMTGNLFVKRSVFKQIGLFNQKFSEMEDMEFGIRAAKEGFSIAYADKAIVWHPPRQTFREMWHKSKRNGLGTFILCHHNPQWAGKYGWKHPLRCIKIAISLRKPKWKLLPFPLQQLSLFTRIKIYLISWIVINIGESYGYLMAWMKCLSNK